MKKSVDENGVPTVAGAQAMFAAKDEARANRAARPKCGGTYVEDHCPTCEEGDALKAFVLLDMAFQRAAKRAGIAAAPYTPSNSVTARWAVAAATQADIAQIVRLTKSPMAWEERPGGGWRVFVAFDVDATAPRTPETVLRAMLLAYGEAALDAEIVYQRRLATCGDDYEAANAERRTSEIARATHATVLTALAVAIVGDAIEAELTRPVFADYEARLDGTRPLNAPPLEV